MPLRYYNVKLKLTFRHCTTIPYKSGSLAQLYRLKARIVLLIQYLVFL